MKVRFLRQFVKDLSKEKSQIVLDQVATAIEQVVEADQVSDIPQLKKLKGHPTAYRIRIGDYRIGVFIEQQAVEFARFVHRKDIYQQFP